ncbi:hypothetical protein Ahy_A03g011483 [Arachis hypogaea]|uniref:Ubiquitin-like protease family profile domain-containing protein n=1 Tax=Arachis hypogaea TaxID=3818 RepID=A0A445DQZ2_ARAHY|nr:hypothetical protein Ahy_A03g011483 [Arachis hypogaea]
MSYDCNVDIVTTMCLILNKTRIKRFEEQNMALGNHGGGEFLHLKTKRPFDIQDYSIFIPYLDMQKLASHPYVNICPVYYGEHWWIWMTDVKKRKFRIIDLHHKTCHLKERMKLNRFVDYNEGICRGQPLVKKNDQIEPPYVDIVEQKMSFDCEVYAEVDHFRVEYVSRILFHEMNQDRDRAIQKSEAIRLSKPSVTLLSPYC